MCSTPTSTSSPLTLTEREPAGCACCAPRDTATPAHQPNTEEAVADFALTGLTCGSCASRVSGAVTALEGVRNVRIDLVPGGTSTLSVISAEPVNSSAIASAVEKAGYRLLTS